jgi:hypothetical protein
MEMGDLAKESKGYRTMLYPVWWLDKQLYKLDAFRLSAERVS